MASEWGQPITEPDQESPLPSWYEDGPVLRNFSRGRLDAYHWGVVETLVWIATRDIRSIEGALGWIPSGGAYGRPARFKQHLGHNAKIVLETYLPGDIAGHAAGCSPFLGDGCQCEELGRIRFCRCRAPNGQCSCIVDVRTSFLEALHDGLPVFGRRDEELEFVSVPKAALADAGFIYAEGGLRLLPSFAEVRFRVDEIKKRWPATWEDRPLRPATLVPGEEEAGRGDSLKKVAALKRFADRAQRGQTKWPKIDEVRLIESTAGEDCGKEASITKWIRPYHPRLFKNGAFDEGAVSGVVADIDAELAADRERRLGAARRRRGSAG